MILHYTYTMLKNKLLTWINLLIMGIYTIPVAYSIWFVGLFDRFTKLKYYIAQSWTIPWMWAARSKVTLIKNYDYKKNQPYVVISNHLSNLDPMMQFRYLKIKWVFMAKKEVYKLPFQVCLSPRKNHVPRQTCQCCPRRCHEDNGRHGHE